MGTTADEIAFGSMTRIAGQSETAALDVESEGGKYRAFVSALERATSLIGAAVSVTTSATALRVGGSDLTNRRSLSIQNKGTKSIFIGPATVTTANGFEIAVGASINIPISEAQTVYGITSSGTQDVRVMEVA